MRIAEDDLRAHVQQFIYEEKAALEHLLMDQHRALGLYRHHQHDADQVGCKARPGRVGDGHDSTVNKGFYLVMLLGGYINIVTTSLDNNTQFAEYVGYHAQLFVMHVFDGDLRPGHCSKAYKRAYFDHIGQQAVFGALQPGYTL